MSFRRYASVVMWTLLMVAPSAFSKVLVSLDEALKLAFPTCTTESETIYLNKQQGAQIKDTLGTELRSDIIVRYRPTCLGAGGKALATNGKGYAYTDTHRVRTKSETLLFVVDEVGAIARIEVLQFDEPQEYRPKGAWYESFLGMVLTEHGKGENSVISVAGATLTSKVTSEAARRVLVVDQILRKR